VRLFKDALKHSHLESRHTYPNSFYLWPIVQDTGAPTTHDKPCSLTYPVYIALLQGSILPGTNQYVSPFSYLSWCEGSNSQSLGRQSSVLPLSQVPSLVSRLRRVRLYTGLSNETFLHAVHITRDNSARKLDDELTWNDAISTRFIVIIIRRFDGSLFAYLPLNLSNLWKESLQDCLISIMLC